MKSTTPQLLTFILASLLLISCFSSQAYSAETLYVRDTLYVELRSGQSFQHRIVHRGLKSGTPLTLIETNEDKSYSLVRTQQGIEGWIQSQYLSTEPSVQSQLDALQEKHIALNTKYQSLNTEFVSMKKQYNDAKIAIEKLSENTQNTENELSEIKAISANAVSLNSENQVLLQKNQELQNQADMLNADNQRLNDSLDNDEFLKGAFAVLIGVFITLLVPRLWPSKSSEWA